MLKPKAWIIYLQTPDPPSQLDHTTSMTLVMLHGQMIALLFSLMLMMVPDQITALQQNLIAITVNHIIPDTDAKPNTSRILTNSDIWMIKANRQNSFIDHNIDCKSPV